MNKITYVVSGMTCHNCETTIKKELLKIRGITDVFASFNTGEVIVTYSSLPNPKKIEKAINEAGYLYVGLSGSSSNRTKLIDVLPIIFVFILIYAFIGLVFGFDFLTRIPSISSATPLVMLFFVGVLTSVHCIGMCGAINLLASVDSSGNKSFKRPLLYNLGRITSYTLMGALIGLLGSFIAINDTTQGLLIIITSVFMLMMGLSMLGWLPKSLYRLLPNFKSKINISNKNTPFVIGFLNGFMPCGPLQAMQLYALSTGSWYMGALSLFLFALGTVPLVFSFGYLFSKLQNKYNMIIKRASSILIVILAVLMMSRGVNYLGFNLKTYINDTFFKVDYTYYAKAEIKDGYQYVEIPLTFSGYKPVVVQVGIPVRFNIKTKDVFRYGCTNSIVIPSLNMEIELKEGDNIIEFTPDKTGTINYSCWMRMVNGHIKVVEDLSKIGE